MAVQSNRHVRITCPVVLVALIGMFGGSLGAQPRQAGLTVTGVAVDATGSVLPHAEVVLTTAGTTTTVATTTTDGAGTFRLASVPPGRYDVHVTFEGFQPTLARVTVGTRTPSPLRVVLPLANVTQHVTVSS